jgi:hypothetical protein
MSRRRASHVCLTHAFLSRARCCGCARMGRAGSEVVSASRSLIAPTAPRVISHAAVKTSRNMALSVWTPTDSDRGARQRSRRRSRRRAGPLGWFAGAGGVGADGSVAAPGRRWGSLPGDGVEGFELGGDPVVDGSEDVTIDVHNDQAGRQRRLPGEGRTNATVARRRPRARRRRAVETPTSCLNLHDPRRSPRGTRRHAFDSPTKRFRDLPRL